MKKHTINFKFAGKKFTFTFRPKEADEWTGFNERGHDFDVHYCEEYKHICVYEVIDGQAQTQKTIFIKELSAKEIFENYFKLIPFSKVKDGCYALDTRDLSDFLMTGYPKEELQKMKKSGVFLFGKEKPSRPKKREPKFFAQKQMEDLHREIGTIASMIHENYFDELQQTEGVMWAHDQIANITPTIAKETLAVPADGWEERPEDFESYTVRRARELFATLDIVVENFSPKKQQLYFVRLPKGHQARREQNLNGYLGFNTPKYKEKIQYSKKEATKKARMFRGEIEKVC